MRKEPDYSDSFPILSRENYNPETNHSTTNILSPTETLSVSLIYTFWITPGIWACRLDGRPSWNWFSIGVISSIRQSPVVIRRLMNYIYRPINEIYQEGYF